MKTRHEAQLVTVVVATPEAGASGTFAILDVLSSVGRAWEVLHGKEPRAPRFLPRLLSIDGEPYTAPNGIRIHPQGALAEVPAPDIVIIPELILGLTTPIPESYGPIASWIRQAYDQGAIVSSVCSGSLLLGMTGLLDGEDATTHWGYCDAMARHFPSIRLRKERILVPAGDGHRLITAGGASSWYDLLLYLIGRFVGTDEARRVADVFLLTAHTQGQLPFAGLTPRRRHEDQMVAAAQLWIADNYKTPNPVAAMAARSRLTERGFLGRFKRATGMSPMDYVQTLRIEEAKHLLETTDLPLDDIAAEVGYAEPASFRRLFRRMVGLSPSAYRRQRLPVPAEYA
jgi:transcriptional regulator GlxA family with amidase domain